MKRIIISLLYFFSVAQAQIQVSTNLLNIVQLNRPLIFDVKITKGQIQNFSRYQMQVDPGVIIEEVDSKGGTFSFEENKVKIVWANTPTETEFLIRMKLRAVSKPLKVYFKIKYFYIEEEQKKEFECLPHRIIFKDTVMPVLMSTPMKQVPSKTTDEKIVRKNDTLNTKDPEKLKAQVNKLKKDSQNAYSVGNLEHKKAEVKLATIAIDEKKVDMISDPEERKQLSEQLSLEKKNTEEELQRAKRVLALAKNLEAQANEIERINRTMNPESYGLPSGGANARKTAVGRSGSSSAPLIKKETDQSGTESQTLNENKNPQLLTGDRSEYKVQIGAFQSPPPKEKYQSYQSAKILREGKNYKLLVGSFQSKEEAYVLRDSLSEVHKGCFVVLLRNGLRVTE